MWFMIKGKGDHFAVFITDDTPRVTDIGHSESGVLHQRHQGCCSCSQQILLFHTSQLESVIVLLHFYKQFWLAVHSKRQIKY